MPVRLDRRRRSFALFEASLLDTHAVQDPEAVRLVVSELMFDSIANQATEP
jgi:hypothetical protein